MGRAAARGGLAAALVALALGSVTPAAAGQAPEPFGPVQLGTQFQALWEHLGATPFSAVDAWPGTTDQRTLAYWEHLGLLVWARGDRVAAVVYWSPGTPEGGGRHPLLPVGPDGLAIGAPAESVLFKYGTPFYRRPFSLRFPGLGVQDAEQWTYSVSERLVYVRDGRVVGLGLFDAQAYVGVSGDQLRAVVPGRALSSAALGRPVRGFVEARGTPHLERQRADGGGLELVWFRPPDTIEVLAGRDFTVEQLVVRSWQSSPGVVRSDARWYQTANGVRLGIPAGALPRLLGSPQRVVTAPADFKPLGREPLQAPVERRFYDGLVVEVKDGRVWGLGVRPLGR